MVVDSFSAEDMDERSSRGLGCIAFVRAVIISALSPQVLGACTFPG